MKPELLKDKIKLPNEFSKMEEGWFDYNKVKSAVEWYRIYYDNPQQLLKDYPSWRDEILEQLIFKTYNVWILNKAFEDVIRDG